MTANADLFDLAHWWGNDLNLTASGDLAMVTQTDRSKQRVLRRLMTAQGDYLAHPTYGGGLPGRIGQNYDEDALEGIIRGQMLLEESVQSSPEPTVGLSQFGTGGVAAAIGYTAKPDALPVSLSFDVET